MKLVIVGTGTDVGKTHVSACLLAHARRLDLRARAYKPVATGMDGACEDAERHAAALAIDYLAPTFAYRRGVSPHLAAREEGTPIDLDRVASVADELARDTDLVLVETAGGLFTPLGDGITNVDLARRLAPAVVVLVAPDRLGVLHDVTACVVAARTYGVAIASVILSAPASSDASTGGNAAELVGLGYGPVVGAFPRAGVYDPATQAVAAQVWTEVTRLPVTARAGCAIDGAR